MSNTHVTITVCHADKHAPLYHRYRREAKPQGAYLELDPHARTASLDYDAEVGGAVPMALWHHQLVRVSVTPYLSLDQCRELAVDASPLLQRICDGYSQDWDGYNKIGTYTDDARAAKEDLETLCSEIEGDAQVMDPADYLADCPTADLIQDGESPEEAAQRHQDEAWADQTIILDGDVAEAIDRILVRRHDLTLAQARARHAKEGGYLLRTGEAGGSLSPHRDTYDVCDEDEALDYGRDRAHLIALAPSYDETQA